MLLNGFVALMWVVGPTQLAHLLLHIYTRPPAPPPPPPPCPIFPPLPLLHQYPPRPPCNQGDFTSLLVLVSFWLQEAQTKC